MVNTDKGFYGYMGKIFGSRSVQNETKDRFYDDSDKEWVLKIKDRSVYAAVSLKKQKIINVYAEDIFALIEVLNVISGEASGGTVPAVYREAYSASGYKVICEKKNFLVIKKERNE